MSWRVSKLVSRAQELVEEARRALEEGRYDLACEAAIRAVEVFVSLVPLAEYSLKPLVKVVRELTGSEELAGMAEELEKVREVPDLCFSRPRAARVLEVAVRLIWALEEALRRRG